MTTSILAAVPRREIGDPIDRISGANAHVETLVECIVEAADGIVSGHVHPEASKQRAERILRLCYMALAEIGTISQQVNTCDDVLDAHTEDRKAA